MSTSRPATRLTTSSVSYMHTKYRHAAQHISTPSDGHLRLASKPIDAEELLTLMDQLQRPRGAA